MSAIAINTQLKRGSFQLEVALKLPAHGVTAILGPSGSGKSSLLRLIAGLERPQQGGVSVGGQVWVDVAGGVCLPPQQRKVGVVFQDYALFEHMTVAQNIGYGAPRAERPALVSHWLQRLHLQGLQDRYPAQLSGGQQQRVALARALAPQPEVLLLDEPFSAVDAYLRHTLRSELKEVISQLQQPVLIISHDLEDVRHMADYIGVMIDGRIRRFDTNAQVFSHPGSYQVARVLGWRNFLYVRSLKGRTVSGGWGEIELPAEAHVNTFCLAIRPEHIRLVNEAEGGLAAEVVQVVELGAVRELACRLNDGSLLYLHRPWNEALPAAGSRVTLQLPLQHLQALPEWCERDLTTQVGQEKHYGEVAAPAG